ncbi:retinoic acid early transcript 1E-like isoform X2 [Nannospalax galili]|uniref:retinoic acid early transcript 1E-like isoform X2 n=1 Tax=Nannospalax galili TaxID=1026970 RepID=UPI00111C066F|nr:retinoic acid early transcript 1E-like isoform X2 [Nannospalax galili]
MAPAAATKFTPGTLALLLVVLQGCLCANLDDIHSLYLNFTVKTQFGPREPWCKVSSSVDKLPFLQYDTDNKANPLGNLGKDIYNTDLWAYLTQRIEYMGQEIRNRLPDIQLEKHSVRGHPTLQVKMFCQHRHGQHVGACWQFTIDGQYSFFFYPMNLTWTVSHPEATGTMKEWEKDKELVKDLKKVSIDDCGHWLEELLKYWKPVPEFIYHHFSNHFNHNCCPCCDPCEEFLPS